MPPLGWVPLYPWSLPTVAFHHLEAQRALGSGDNPGKKGVPSQGTAWGKCHQPWGGSVRHRALQAHGASSGAGPDWLSDGALASCRVTAKVGCESCLPVCGTKGKQGMWPAVGCTGIRDELP